MSQHRLRLAATGLALVTGATLTTVPAAAAAPTEHRTITIKGVEPRNDVFFVKGHVDPGWAGRRAVLQRKLRRASGWRRWHRFRTSDTSRYRQRVRPLHRPGTVCYRVRIRGTARYLESFSDKVCIRTFWK